MWGYKKETNVISDFFAGFNIFKKMDSSLFGKYKKTFNEIFTKDDVAQYSLPKVIVIGNESTGKSSLLENITKCQLFPRDNKLCTKCPVHIKLSNGAKNYSVTYTIDDEEKTTVLENKVDIYKTINEYMMSLPPDYISEDKITVNISDNDMPTFEFYDLPGIRTYPPKTAKTTINLCKKYLSDKNSIVLCVVPCTTTRLTSCQSISLISEMGMESNCILALTMADRLQPENVEELLIKRIIKTSDELEGLNFAGYIAVVNRTHTNSHSLIDHDQIEEQWFRHNIINCMPVEYEQFKETITQNVTINKLINGMDKLYSNFIQNNWKPRIIEDIQKKIKSLELEYNKLGPEIIDVDILNKKILKFLNDSYEEYVYCDTYENNENKEECLDDEKVEFEEDYYNSKEYMMEVYSKYFQQNHDSLLTIFDNNFSEKNKYKLFRFETIKSSVFDRIQSNIIIYREKEKQHILDLCTDEMIRQYCNNYHFNKSTKREWIDKYIKNLYNLLILYPSIVCKVTFEKDDYVESTEYQKKRSDLLILIEKTRDHLELINNISDE